MSNGRRNLRYKDGKPLCAALSEGLKSSSVPIVRTLGHACHYSRTRPLLHKAAQVHTAPITSPVGGLPFDQDG